MSFRRWAVTSYVLPGGCGELRQQNNVFRDNYVSGVKLAEGLRKTQRRAGHDDEINSGILRNLTELCNASRRGAATVQS